LGTATKLPFKSAFFDDIFCISVLEHLRLGTTASAIEEMFRVLKPKGSGIITVDIGSERKSLPNRYHKDDIYTCRDLKYWYSLLSNVGFEIALDPHGQGKFNDPKRVERVCLGYNAKPRGFATYRFYCRKPGYRGL